MMATPMFAQSPEVDPVQEYLDLVSEKERRDALHRWDFYTPYPKQAEWLSWNVPIKVMFGGNRCLGGETEIFDPILRCKRRVDSISSDFHVWAWDGTKRVIAKAQRPFHKDRQPIYQFIFEDGTSITASPAHLFLGNFGWVPAGSLNAEDHQESSVCLLPSSLDNAQLALLEDALRSIQTTPGFQFGCPACSCSGDEPPLLAQVCDRGVVPSQDGVLERSSREQDDDQACREPHIHLNPNGDPLPNSGGLDLIQVPFSLGQDRIECKVCLPVSDLCPDILRSQNHQVQTQSEGPDPPESSCKVVLSVAHSGSHEQRNEQPGHESESSIQGTPGTLSCPYPEEVLESDLDPQGTVSGAIRRALSACVVTSKLKISRIEYLRHDLVWDFTVEEFGNYFIGAVLSHNTGKTMTASYELVCHLTGKYPDWWTGKRFWKPIKAWCVAIDYKQLREAMQFELFGDVKMSFGTGMMPKELIIDHSMAQGIADVVDQVWVRHVTGGISILSCKVNGAGREAFQGPARDVISIDEECDHDVFTECRLRTMTVHGIMIVTFTPKKGKTSLVKFLLDEPDSSVVRRIIVGWDDVPHLTEEDKRQMSVGLLPHEIEAIRYGLPSMARGLVYPFTAKQILVKPFDIEPWWPGIIGLDVATAGTTAAVLMRWDPNAKRTYVTNCHKLAGNPSPSIHASVIRQKFGNYPIRIDPSAGRTERDGDSIVKDYQLEFGNGWEIKNAKNAVYTGIRRLYTGMEEGSVKIFDNQRDWIEEWQEYIWDVDKDGNPRLTDDGNQKPRKVNDHLMDSTRYDYMDIKEARILKSLMYQKAKKTWEPLDPVTGY
jgi:phage terminase large subunit-like protein